MENFKRIKYSCYYSYVAMSSVFALPPILFVTLRDMYNVSYTLLGTLVLINYCTQLIIDLVFTFFAKYFNIKKAVRLMPLLTSLGLSVYAVMPNIFPGQAYLWLVTGTVIFSVSAGLSEVLLSPLVASLPSDNPKRDMSILHSLYAYGVVTVVVISTVFLNIFGRESWMYLALFWALLPVISFVLYCTSPIPSINISHKTKSTKYRKKKFILFLCVICIFLGSATENMMTNWISGYMEKALHISKVAGDILGMAAFAIVLGIGRTSYARYGKNISKVLLLGMVGATVCYIVAGICPVFIVSMIACVFTGFCTSMLWPGTLIMMEERLPNVGVAAYALMAAGGDLGGSVAPQLMGIVIDKVSVSSWAVELSAISDFTTEQLGMKVGMLTGTVFPILGIMLLIYIRRFSKRHLD